MRSGRRFAATVSGLIVVVAGFAYVASAAVADTKVDRTLVDERITESSGLAASTLHPGVLYTHNDSDDAPRVFAITPDGQTQAVLMLRGAPARDWEGMSPGKRGTDTLWVGDIGDNINGWGTYRVFRFSEPKKLQDRLVAWKQYDLRYADGESRNAESLMVHPVTGRLYVVTKNVMGGALYAAPETLSDTAPNTLRKVSDALAYATDAAFSPDGSLFVVRGYVDAKVYRTDEPSKSIATVDLPAQPQGESIAWSPDGRFLYAGSEGVASKVYRVPLPPKVLAALGDEVSATSAASSTADGDEPVIGPTGPDTADAGSAGLPREQIAWLALGSLVLIALGFSLRSWAKHDRD